MLGTTEGLDLCPGVSSQAVGAFFFFWEGRSKSQQEISLLGYGVSWAGSNYCVSALTVMVNLTKIYSGNFFAKTQQLA